MVSTAEFHAGAWWGTMRGVSPPLPSPALSSGAEARSEALYDEYRQRVFAWALRYARGDSSAAEDITHDVFLKAFAALSQLSNLEDMGGWLYRVTANLALSRLRRERFRFEALRKWAFGDSGDSKVRPDPEEVLLLAEDTREAKRFLDTLPGAERVVLCMKLLDGLSQREIATAVGKSEGYVSKLIARGMARAREAGWEVGDG